jgi:serine/threonine protein kinase
MKTIGRYQLVRRLGIGGMAEVFLARLEGAGGFQKSLVLKLILPAFADEPAFVELFFREAKIAARLNHPGIVQVFDFGSTDGEHYLAMEYVDGLTLRQLIQREWGEERPIPLPLALRILAQCCDALGYAHTFVHPETRVPMGVLHRDLSPENILLSHSGGVKLSDFGLARAIDATHSTSLRGKSGYLAPELMSGSGRIDERADLFALGVVMYEMLAGRRPFMAATDQAVMQAIIYEPHPSLLKWRPDCPAPLAALVDRLLAKDPELRFQSARGVLAAIEAVLSGWAPVRSSELSRFFAGPR